MPKKHVNIVESIRDGSATRADAERKLAEFGMGVLNALKERRTTIEEAQTDLFNMDSYQNVGRFHYNPNLREFLIWGMELEDVAALTPSGLSDSYRRMTQVIRRVLKASRRTAETRTVRARVKTAAVD